MNEDQKNDSFNFLRLVAAYLVLCGHMCVVAGRNEPSFSAFTLSGIGIAIFLSISGYLVTQSWFADPHFGRFALRRALRVFPALAVVVVLSAFAMGPLVTKIPEAQYFDSDETWAYLRNILLDTDYTLPGVFETLPLHGIVNSSLWTLPIGVLMYLLLAVVGRIKGAKFPLIFLGLVIGLCIGSALYSLYVSQPAYLGTMEVHQLLALAPYFWVACLLYIYRARIEFTLTRSVAIYSVSVLMATTPYFTFWSWIAIPYITISFATQSDRLFRTPWQIGDLSYGIYLYTFPVQQVLWQNYGARLPLLQTLALSALIATLFAWATWEIVEYPALKLKRKIKAHELINNRRPSFKKAAGL